MKRGSSDSIETNVTGQARGLSKVKKHGPGSWLIVANVFLFSYVNSRDIIDST